MALISNRLRVNLNQWIDYRIFVISAYHKDELTDDVLNAAASQNLVLSQDIRETSLDNYYFLKYSIDDYVDTFSISHSVESNPSSLNLTIFPELNEINKPENDFKFFYKLKNRYTPVFRRWDYIEVQVAELTMAENSLNTRQVETKNFSKLLQNNNRAVDYENENISKFYKVRFRGFITDITEDDSVDGGRTITLQAKSMLYFLSQTPFITNLALFTDRFVETQRAHLLENQFLVLYGDLLTDLRDTTTRTNLLLEETFQTKSLLETTNTQVLNVSGQAKTFKDQQYLGQIDDAQQKFVDLLKRLSVEQMNKATGTQALLIPLTEIYLALVNNTAGNNLLYTIFKSELFNQEIQFTGENTEYISNFTYLLQTMTDWANTIKYFLFEKASGTVVFDKPNLNGTVDMVIEPYRWRTYSYKESEGGYLTEYYVTPGTAFQVFDDSIRQTFFQTSGYSLDQLRRYGYRRPANAETNPNISSPKALEQYAKANKAINNARLKTLTCTIPYDKKIDIGSIVWFQEKNLVGYVTELQESITYGGDASMNITLEYLREITEIKKFTTKLNKSPVKAVIAKIAPQTIAKKIKATETVELDPVEVVNAAIEEIRRAGAKNNKTEAEIDLTIKNFIADTLTIEEFPEYTFVSDFYSGKMQPILQSVNQDKQERQVD